MRLWLAGLAFLAPALASAQPSSHPVVGELFTSEGCSSCPPADAKVAKLARTRPDLLLLTFHVTYWNSLGWKDPFSLEAATQRQRRYVALGIGPEVYTPALVVDGRMDVVGSDPAAVDGALRQAAASQGSGVPVSVQSGPGGVDVTVGAGPGAATVLLIGYDPLHRTAIGRGENSGRTLEEANIVRSISALGAWAGAPERFHAAAPAGQDVAVLVQRADGPIIGAVATRPGP